MKKKKKRKIHVPFSERIACPKSQDSRSLWARSEHVGDLEMLAPAQGIGPSLRNHMTAAGRIALLTDRQTDRQIDRQTDR